jgi:hypothetical protein
MRSHPELDLFYKRLGSQIWLWGLCLCVGGICLNSATPARADLLVRVESTSAWTGSVFNPLEFTLTNSGPDAVNIGAFAVGFALSNSGLNLIDVTYDTTLANFIFQGSSLLGPSLVDPSFMPLSSPVIFADVYDIPGSSITLLAGETVGLGVLWFDAPGPQQIIAVILDPSLVSFADDINLFPDSQIQLMDGTLTILPEPGTLPLMLVATTGLLFSFGKRRQTVLPGSR